MITKAKLFSVLLLLLSVVCAAHAQDKPASPIPKIEQAGTLPVDPSLRATQAELVRRQELVFACMQSLAEGEKLLGSEELDKARERFEFSLKNLPDGEQGNLARSRATKGLASVKIKLSSKALEQGKREEALKLAQQANALNPSGENKAALNKIQDDIKQFELSKINPESTENNPALTPEFKDKLDAVTKLFLQGENYFETGQYDLAIKQYGQILALDPYNKAARGKIARVERYKAQSYRKGREQARSEALSQITARWSENVPLEAAGTKQAEDNATPSNLGKMTKKLQSIIVPTLQFNEVAIEDAVRFLADKSRELDPDKEGINFVLKKEATNFPAPATPAAAPAGGAPAAAPALQPVFAPVTLKLDNVSLEQVLNFLTNITPLKYKVEEYAVYLLPLNESSEILQNRTFAVPLGFFKNSGLKSTGAASGSISSGSNTASAESVRTNVVEELKDKGVNFVGGATATYLAGSNKMVVKNTPDQLDVIQTLIDSQKQESPQIEIETKFAEFTEDSLKEIAFNWYVNLKNNPALSRIPGISAFPASSVFDPLGFFSNFVPGTFQGDISANTRNRSETDLNQNNLDQLLQQNVSSLNGSQPVDVLTGGTLSPNTPNTFRMGGVIDGRGFMLLANLIDQTKGVDLLSAPKVTTQSTKEATVEVVREMRYPGDSKKPQFNGAPVLYDGRQISLVTPPTPNDFVTQNVGVSMKVTPRAYADRRIDLDLAPEVVDFEGFVNYGGTAFQGETQTATITPLTTYSILKPVFNFRTLKTRVQVVDGQTIALGGLIREDSQKIKDKVPVLGDVPFFGRLFRSEVDKKVKRNLMIFVTARLIRSTGKPAFTQTALATSTADSPTLTQPESKPR